MIIFFSPVLRHLKKGKNRYVVGTVFLKVGESHTEKEKVSLTRRSFLGRRNEGEGQFRSIHWTRNRSSGNRKRLEKREGFLRQRGGGGEFLEWEGAAVVADGKGKYDATLPQSLEYVGMCLGQARNEKETEQPLCPEVFSFLHKVSYRYLK